MTEGSEIPDLKNGATELTKKTEKTRSKDCSSGSLVAPASGRLEGGDEIPEETSDL
jgi:hypothetical protein